MNPADLAGWLAASLTFATFACGDMARLRLLARLAQRNLSTMRSGRTAAHPPIGLQGNARVILDAWRGRQPAAARLSGRPDQKLHVGQFGAGPGKSSDAIVDKGAPLFDHSAR
jgi:hypothetical protein